MKVAVTGASGFIGRYVLEELVKRNIEIVATVDLPNGHHCRFNRVGISANNGL